MPRATHIKGYRLQRGRGLWALYMSTPASTAIGTRRRGQRVNVGTPHCLIGMNQWPNSAPNMKAKLLALVAHLCNVFETVSWCLIEAMTVAASHETNAITMISSTRVTYAAASTWFVTLTLVRSGTVRSILLEPVLN